MPEALAQRSCRANASAARGIDALPIGLAEGCTLVRDVAKDAVLTAADVRMPAERLSDRLWRRRRRVIDGRPRGGRGSSSASASHCVRANASSSKWLACELPSATRFVIAAE